MRVRRTLCAALCLLLLTTGCWNRTEVNDLGVVTAFAVDAGEEQAVRMTLYVARAAAGGANREQGSEKTTWVVAREGSNLSEAFQQISKASPRRLTLHHTRNVLIGEAYARKDISDLLDFLVRNPQMRLTVRPMVTHGRAQDVLELQPQMEALLSEVLHDIIDAQALKRQQLKEFLVARTSYTHSGWMYALRTLERPAKEPGSADKVAEQFGAGLFLGDKLVELISPAETQLLNMLLNNAIATIISVPCPNAPDQSLSARLREVGTQSEPVWQGDQLTFHVRMEIGVDLIRSECKGTVIEPSARSRLEMALDQKLRQDVTALIMRFQELGVDPVGFGKWLQLAAPDYFRRIALKWPEVWPEASVQVSVKTTIRQAGLLLKPGNKTEAELP